MKTGLLLKENGEILQTKFKSSKDAFKLDWFPIYTNYKKYNNYIVLYNPLDDVNENMNENINVLPFTLDKFYGDILVIKIDENLIVINFTMDCYLKILSKIKIEENEMYYSSDQDDELIEDKVLFCL